MTHRELLDDITDEITFSGSLPYNLPEKELNKILSNAKLYFYDNWKYSLEPKYLVIPLQVFAAKQFLNSRTITMPDCVAFIHMCKEMTGGGSIWGTMDRDFSDDKILGSEIMLTPFTGDALVYRTIMMSFMDLTKQFTLNGNVQYNFNKNTKRLSILGHTPRYNIVIKAMVKIQDDDMYNDEMFQRYVRAKSKLRLSDMLSSFEFNLPGGIKINYTTMSAAATKEFDKVLVDMQSENSPDILLFY